MLLASTTRSLLKSSVNAFEPTSNVGALVASSDAGACTAMALRANTTGSPGGDEAFLPGTISPIGEVVRLAHEDSGSWPLMISLPYCVFMVANDSKIAWKSVFLYVASSLN